MHFLYTAAMLFFALLFPSINAYAQLYLYPVNSTTFSYCDVSGKAMTTIKFTSYASEYIASNDFGYYCNKPDECYLIDSRGQSLSNKKFENVGKVREGLAAVWTGNGFGFVNKTGEVVIPGSYINPQGFSEGLCAVKFPFNNMFGFIDTKGNVAIDPNYDSASSFNNGISHVRRDKLHFAIDKSGKVLFQSPNNFGSFSEGLAWIKSGEKYGFIDTSGKIVIQPQFDDFGSFHDGFCKVLINGKHQFIDKSGKVTFSVKFDEINDFNDGYAVVKVDGKYGAIDKEGKLIVEPKYSLSSGSFLAGKCVFIDNGKPILVDTKGNVTPIFALEKGIRVKWSGKNLLGLSSCEGSGVVLATGTSSSDIQIVEPCGDAGESGKVYSIDNSKLTPRD